MYIYIYILAGVLIPAKVVLRGQVILPSHFKTQTERAQRLPRGLMLNPQIAKDIAEGKTAEAAASNGANCSNLAAVVLGLPSYGMYAPFQTRSLDQASTSRDSADIGHSLFVGCVSLLIAGVQDRAWGT